MSDQNSTYNGWTNYPTWNVALWMDNDPGLQEYIQEMTGVAIEQSQDNPNEAEGFLADRLKDFFRDEVNPLVYQASMWSDLMGYVLGLVNWEEIASHLVADYC